MANEISRDYDFSPGTTIVSAQVDAEFNELYNLLNGTELVKNVRLGAGTISNVDAKLSVTGQAEFATVANGRVLSIWKPGESTPRIDLNNLGQIRTVASQRSVTPSSQLMVLLGSIFANGGSSLIGNVGAGEDDLISLSIGAETMNGTNLYLNIKGGGFTAANANNKRFRFYVKTTAVIDSGVITPNNKPYFYDIQIYAIPGSSSWLVVGVFKCDATEVRVNTVVAGVDHTVANTIKWTAEAVADNDIVQNFYSVEKGFGLNG